RLKTAIETNSGKGWSQDFSYDVYGNRGMTSSFTDTGWDPTAFDTKNNRVMRQGLSYDAGGNLQTAAGFTMTYDAENRLTRAQGDLDVQCMYDGGGQRVKRTKGGETTIYVYDTVGQLAAECGGQAPAGGRVYRSEDILASTRLITDANGAVVQRIDYT